MKDMKDPNPELPLTSSAGNRSTCRPFVEVDVDKNLLMVRGAVPGARGSLLVIRKSRSAKRG